MGVARPETPDFGPLAESYDRLRPVDENWWELFELLVVEGDLAGRRVLDVGCGTGAFAAALAGRGARVWGIDPSEEMLARARARGGERVAYKHARAEALPFKDGWFDRVVLRTVVHLLERPQAFAELARVLAPSGRAAIATFAPEHFEWFWLTRLFPSVREIDRGRFPTAATLTRELEEAGFTQARARALHQRGRLDRDAALERVRGRYISTLRLLDEETFAEGLARAERELPATVEYGIEWVVVAAER